MLPTHKRYDYSIISERPDYSGHGKRFVSCKSAFLLGAERVIAIDRLPYRLRIAHDKAGAEILSYEGVDTLYALMEIRGGRGMAALSARCPSAL